MYVYVYVYIVASLDEDLVVSPDFLALFRSTAFGKGTDGKPNDISIYLYIYIYEAICIIVDMAIKKEEEKSPLLLQRPHKR